MKYLFNYCKDISTWGITLIFIMLAGIVISWPVVTTLYDVFGQQNAQWVNAGCGFVFGLCVGTGANKSLDRIYKEKRDGKEN